MTTPTETPSWDLVTAAQRGDHDAFGTIYRRYVDVVHRYVYYRTRNRHLTEDITSETFLKALRSIDSVSAQGKDVATWLVTIARNLILDHVKSSRVRRVTLSANPGYSATDAANSYGTERRATVWLNIPEPRDGGDPATEVVSAAVVDELLRCVSQLPSAQRECVTLRFLTGLSVAETAAVMRRAEGSVKALTHRGIRTLAKQLPGELR
jgi:RNA polymerase sigma-70 factor (ECF subfamily)